MTVLVADSPLVAKVVPSPNQNARRDGATPDMILLHYTGMRQSSEAVLRLSNPLAEVSAHYVVFEDGRIFQMVAEAARAWHAGVGSWAGHTDINSVSIGIEIANPGHDWGYLDFPPAQVEAVTQLCLDIARRRSVAPARILAHSDIAPRRKADPGEKFPWHVLAAAGVGHWVEPAPLGDGRSFALGDEGQPIQALQAMFAYYGYGLEITGVFDEATQTVVTAFQRHFRPARVDGVADASTILTLRNLIAALPATA